jgi:hypothetical protein
MPVRFVFRCDFCERLPDPLTQLSAEKAVMELTWGAYQDLMPERWLMWHGRGLYGQTRYACPDHRSNLVAFLREHYGTIGWHPWKRPPYPSSLHSGDTDRAWMIQGRCRIH